MDSLKTTPWVAKLDGTAVCEYCHRVFLPGPIGEQHAPDCPWLLAHKDDPAYTWESEHSKAAKRLLQE